MNKPQLNFDFIRNSNVWTILENDHNLQANLFSFLIHFLLFIFMVFQFNGKVKYLIMLKWNFGMQFQHKLKANK